MPLQFADVNVGVLYLLSVTSIGVYGITIGGWSSNNKYSMLGGIRSAAQLISYELALGLSILVAIMLTDTPATAADGVLSCANMWGRPAESFGALSMCRIVESQAGWWNIFKPTGIHGVLYFLAGVDGRGCARAVRPGRSRAGAGRRLQHRVLVDEVRTVLHGRVHQADRGRRRSA